MLIPARRLLRLLLAVAAVAALGALLPTAASAACAERDLSQPFLPWGDAGDYFLAPNGGFEDGATGWTLAGRASVTDGNERLGLTSGWHRLRLRDGGSAASDAFCITSSEESIRFAVRNAGRSASTLTVIADVTYLVDGEPTTSSIELGAIEGGTTWWEPSDVFRYGRFPTDDAELSIRFVNDRLGGEWHIDAVLVDPYRCC